jgi:hypothetical protein
LTKSAKLDEGDRDPDHGLVDQEPVASVLRLKFPGSGFPAQNHIEIHTYRKPIALKSNKKIKPIVFKSNYQIKYLVKNRSQGVSLVGNERR